MIQTLFISVAGQRPYSEDDTALTDLLSLVKQGNENETGDATDRLGIGEARKTDNFNVRLFCFSSFYLYGNHITVLLIGQYDVSFSFMVLVCVDGGWVDVS
jgi:hypothetical protein